MSDHGGQSVLPSVCGSDWEIRVQGFNKRGASRRLRIRGEIFRRFGVARVAGDTKGLGWMDDSFINRDEKENCADISSRSAKTQELLMGGVNPPEQCVPQPSNAVEQRSSHAPLSESGHVKHLHSELPHQ